MFPLDFSFHINFTLDCHNSGFLDQELIPSLRGLRNLYSIEVKKQQWQSKPETWSAKESRNHSSDNDRSINLLFFYFWKIFDVGLHINYAHCANHKDSLKIILLQSDGDLFNPGKDIFRSISCAVWIFFTICDKGSQFRESRLLWLCMQGSLFVYLIVLDNLNLQRSKRIFKICACSLLVACYYFCHRCALVEWTILPESEAGWHLSVDHGDRIVFCGSKQRMH